MSSGPQSRLANELYLAAAALNGDERQRYLDDHCPSRAVREQVERMLAADSPPSLNPGSRVGHYEIRAKIGAGGMGWVYEAQDLLLNRTVAIKVVPSGELLLAGPNTLAREAQAASALNHPNIVTVYEIGQEGATEFIVMERITGQTLARRIGTRGIELREALRLAIQVADALASAHEAGIIHRDLKPGNVMITERGQAKVLDFGLAKRIATESTQELYPTATMTKPGKVFGTVAYMSPEQAQGVQLDARSDVFSFGCVLYEMITGQRAFHEEGDLLTLAAVVGKEPRPAEELKPGLPARLQRIIEICLRKKRMERWHHMADVRLLLEEVLQELDAPSAAAPSRARRRWLEIPLAVAAGAVLAVWAFWMAAPKAAEPGPAPVLHRVTMDLGLSGFPALSRTGNLLAFASDRADRGNLDIWVQQIGGREPIQLTHDDSDDSDPDFSPDGTRVAFRSERGGGGVYVVPALGGEEVLVAPGGRNPRFSPDGRWIAYWEGRELGGYLPGSANVFVVEAGGGQPRRLGAEMAAALYPVWSPKGDAVLALGRRDADRPLDPVMDWWVLPLEKGPAHGTGALARLQKQRLVVPAWEVRLQPLAWYDPTGSKSSRVLFAAGQADAAGSGDVGNLWEFEVNAAGEPRGPATPVTSGPGYQLQASVASANGRDRTVFANLAWKVGVWEAPFDAERGHIQGNWKQTTEKESYAAAPNLSRDGSTLVYVSRSLGQWGLHARDTASGKELTLVSAGPDIARISGDGSTVVYGDLRGNLFSLPRRGGKVEMFCEACGSPTGVSLDGRRVVYEPMKTEDLTVYDLTQRKSAVLARRPNDDTLFSGGTFSPDEKWIAFHAVETRLGMSRIWIARAEGAFPVPEAEWIAITDGRSEERYPVWSPSGNLLYFLSERDGFRCVWARKLNPSTRKPDGEAFAVAHFHSARQSLKRITSAARIGLAVSRNRLMLAFGELTGNIWMEEKGR